MHTGTGLLSEADVLLVKLATETTARAYAPYSRFHVGVAILSVDGKVAAGSNQENGAFPVGQCAERVALYNFTSQYGREALSTIAIAVDNPLQEEPASPCGACRQLLMEYRKHQTDAIRLLLCVKGRNTIIEIPDVAYLLPLAFDGSFLGI
jgi:cytidine deaminase